MENAASHLSIIIDLSPQQWHLSAQAQTTPDQPTPFSLADFLPPLFVFLNAHLACQHENTLTIVGALPGKSSVLFSSNETHTESGADPSVYQPFKSVNAAVVQRLSQELNSFPDGDALDAPVSLVGALTKSLCSINRLLNPASNSDTNTVNAVSKRTISPRILIFSVSPELSASYIPIMNSIFCAQRQKVILDVCKLYGPDTVFLQQAAYLTGGSYISVPRRESLLQYLMTCFLSPPSVRKLMAVPTEDKVDFRAACFCHKTIVDIGFICSVCLSIFCKPTPVCSTCRAKFPMKSLTRLKELFKPVLPPGIPDPSPAILNPPPPPQIPTLTANINSKGRLMAHGQHQQRAQMGHFPPPYMGMPGGPVPGMPPMGIHPAMHPPPGHGPPMKKGKQKGGPGGSAMDWRATGHPPSALPLPTPPPPSR